jgi:hypothetical protein
MYIHIHMYSIYIIYEYIEITIHLENVLYKGLKDRISWKFG